MHIWRNAGAGRGANRLREPALPRTHGHTRTNGREGARGVNADVKAARLDWDRHIMERALSAVYG
jgi:hypothetical protein